MDKVYPINPYFPEKMQLVHRFEKDVPQTTFCGNYHLIETQNMNN